MPAIRIRHNCRFLVLDEFTVAEHLRVFCRLRNGDYRPMRWGGFTTSIQVGAQTVGKMKMEAYEYTNGDRFSGWTRLKDDDHLLGCLVGQHVYGVLIDHELKILGA